MKRLFTFLLVLLAAFTLPAAAQPGTNCNADFGFQVIGSTVYFNHVISGDTTNVFHSWTFGDGTPGSADWYPVHTYAAAGTYQVKHILTRLTPNGAFACSDTLLKMVSIVNTNNCNLKASYSFVRDSLQPNKVYFTNLSTPAGSINAVKWNFGDGTYSYGWNATHTFATSGAFNVCLLVKDTTLNNCSDDTCRIVQIQLPPPVCNIQANFTSFADSTQPRKIYFTNTTINYQPGDSVRWTFGDGTSSTDLNPVHTYAQPGNYTVCLRIKRYVPAGTPPCVSEICKLVNVNSQPCNIQANFISVPDSMFNPNRILFYNTTVNFQPGDSVRWTFGDGTSSSDLNPIHTYAQPGNYTVCLRITRPTAPGAAPCISEKCKQVIVAQQPPCNIQPNFTITPDSSVINKFYFTNTTIGYQAGDTVSWNFGDNNVSYSYNAVHIYAQPGSYITCLTIKRPSLPGVTPCVRYFCDTVIVTGNTCNIQANFTSQRDSAQYNKVYFTNTSLNYLPGDSIRWTFGDGSSSTQANPSHSYNQTGSYTVCLRIKRPAQSGVAPCVSEICKLITVLIPCNLSANFNWQTDTAQYNKIKFNNLSTPLSNTDSIRWIFGDGTSSNDVNPVHVYNQPGSYVVCLRVKKVSSPGALPCVQEICKLLMVQPVACTVQPSFTWRKDSINSKKIIFTNKTMAPNVVATAKWSFGDGTFATSWNAVHEYAQPGKYIVCLTIQTSNYCSRTKCDTVTVTQECSQLSKFNATKVQGDNQKFVFTPVSPSAGVQYAWSFGDSTSSTLMNPVHRYANPGIYTVCLTIRTSSNCVSTTCKQVIVLPQLTCDSIRVNYIYQRDAFMPNKVYFFAISNFPILLQRWTITKLPASNIVPPVVLFKNNPVYIFPDTGTYKVCLRAITIGGCVKETCQTITISQVPQCQLQAFPNPAQSVVTVNVPLVQPTLINAYIFNMQQVLVKQKQQQGNIGNNPVTFNISDLVPGLYTIKVVYGNRTCYSKFQKL